jgi:5-methylcytosine-specific restriction endonuclease McrA
MSDASPILVASPDLIRAAALRRDWSEALRQLGLAVNDDNMRTFRERALRLGVDVSHLRGHGIEALAPEVLREAANGANSQLEVLTRLGLKPGGGVYRSLRRAYETHGIPLPLQRPNRRGDASHFTWTDEELREAYFRARSIADILRSLGLVPRGGNYRTVKERLRALDLDPAALPGQAWARGRSFVRLSLQEMLVDGRPCAGATLAKRLITAGILERCCARCKRAGWEGQLIPLELDHINGDHDDNRLENLRLLCPNCHALTETYRGRNVRRRRTLSLA